ncbi:MAG TPA: extradiol ring-cleavage dioxygenase, partial [Firmicutes bacterium]|nr:extradiol ring-cleavage dioxygenase [Bacillota bacterium]
MSVLIGAISPHPPLLIPEVGGREREKVRRTDLSLKRMAEEFKSLNLNT